MSVWKNILEKVKEVADEKVEEVKEELNKETGEDLEETIIKE